MGRFRVVSFFHIVHSHEFVNLSVVEITYIMNTHQESEEVLEVLSAVCINIYLANIYYLMNILEIDFLFLFFMFCF